MAGRQRTFELIPTSLVKSNGPKPPMTSKAAKKAHQLATRGPKVSRLEQRRRDAEELARQKREYEREKASIRAKAAREKKAAKEQAERDARRKMGIPEPSRFVRASQPTISRFVKNGNKRMWKEMDTVAKESDTITVCNDEGDQAALLESPTKKVKTGDESEDEYGGFPSYSQSELGAVLEKVESSAPSESNQNDRTERGLTAALEPEHEPQSNEPSEVIRTKKSSDEFPWKSSENLDDMAATQLLSEAADAAARSAQQHKPSMIQTLPELVPPRPDTTTRPALSMPITKPDYISLKTIMTSRPALQERCINMPPPPVPTKGKLSISFAPSLPKPRTLPRLPPQPVSNVDLPPSATQAFLEDHLDDFFPSPSQEIRELLDDIDDLPTNTQIARELEPSLPTAKAPQEDFFADLICTQDFILSSQDILEITTPCPPPSKPNKAEQSTSTPTPLTTNPSTRQPRRRFFEEKDEDLLHAAIQESKMLTEQKEQRIHGRKSSGRMLESKPGAVQKEQRGQTHERDVSGRTKKAFKRTLSNATDYGEDEFHDCEEELLALC